jgi:hypothetical protein
MSSPESCNKDPKLQQRSTSSNGLLASAGKTVHRGNATGYALGLEGIRFKSRCPTKPPNVAVGGAVALLSK